MTATIQHISDYLLRVLTTTAMQMLIALGPMLCLAIVLQTISSYVRAATARLVGLNVYVYLTAPGIVIHELGHALFCVIFRHRIVEMKLFQPEDGSLGYVKHAFNPRSFYQNVGNFFIGTGPIWLGSGALYLLARLLLGRAIFSSGNTAIPTIQSWGDFRFVLIELTSMVLQSVSVMVRSAHPANWQFWLFAYAAFCIGSHITLSRPDLRGAWGGFVVLVAAVVLFNALTLALMPEISIHIANSISHGLALLYSAVAMVICVNLIFALLAATALLLRRGSISPY